MTDAVCDSARRIIGRFATRGGDGEALAPVNGARGDDDRPPTAAMGKYAASIAKWKGTKPPRGYTKSAAVCRAFLDRHATRQSRRRKAESPESGPASGAPAGGKPGNTGTARSGKRATRPAKPRLRKFGRDETDGSSGTPQAASGSGANSDPIRKQGTGVRSGRPIRDGWLVCAARRRSCRLSRAGMAVEAPAWSRGPMRQRVH